jgi:hypothetical protein
MLGFSSQLFADKGVCYQDPKSKKILYKKVKVEKERVHVWSRSSDPDKIWRKNYTLSFRRGTFPGHYLEISCPKGY